MRIRVNQNWYSGGIPEYQAGKEYDVDDGVGSRLVRRGVAEQVVHAPVVDDQPVKKVTRKKRRSKVVHD